MVFTFQRNELKQASRLLMAAAFAVSVLAAYAQSTAPKLAPTAVEKSTKPVTSPVVQADRSYPEPIEVKLVRHKVVTENGKEVLQAAETAKPGEILLESVTYTNRSKNAVTKLEATLPIPLNTEFQLNSNKPSAARAAASIDGTTFRTMPLKRKVTQANGVEVEQLVPANEYRFLRWYPSELAAGKSVTYSARFKISDARPDATANAK